MLQKTAYYVSILHAPTALPVADSKVFFSTTWRTELLGCLRDHAGCISVATRPDRTGLDCENGIQRPPPPSVTPHRAPICLAIAFSRQVRCQPLRLGGGRQGPSPRKPQLRSMSSLACFSRQPVPGRQACFSDRHLHLQRQRAADPVGQPSRGRHFKAMQVHGTAYWLHSQTNLLTL